jgi:hypothetical protein
MLILNYSHPLTAEQIAQVTTLVGKEPTIRTIAVKIDNTQPLAAQLAALADESGISPDEWQSTPLIINPPGLAAAATALLAELHGRIGHFPTIMRLRPVPGSTPTVYEVAELINLQTVREQAHGQR